MSEVSETQRQQIMKDALSSIAVTDGIKKLEEDFYIWRMDGQWILSPHGQPGEAYRFDTLEELSQNIGEIQDQYE